MLYVSTRNTTDTYTAYRALHEDLAPDDGFYVPFHLPVFSDNEIAALRKQSCCETVTQLLNLFFGLRLQAWDVECAIGRNPFQLIPMQHKLTVAEGWHNPGNSFNYLLSHLYRLCTAEKSDGKLPVGWARIGIEIALLFGLYGTMEFAPQGFDISVTADDFAEVAAISYAKDMGLPVHLIVCACNENDVLWDLVNRGECSVASVKTDAEHYNYLEVVLFKCLGADAAMEYIAACAFNTPYRIDEALQNVLASRIYAAVVSNDRIGSVAANMYRTNAFRIDGETAFAYGGLQDFRAASGISADTVIVAKERPNLF